MRRAVSAILLAFLASACHVGGAGTESGGEDDAEGDGDPSPAELGLGEAYTLDEVWDISSALAPETLGRLASDLSIDIAVRTLGVPSAAEDEAQGVLGELVGDRISRPVADAAAQSATLESLRENLRAADVESEWLLAPGEPDRARILAVSYQHAEVEVAIDLSAAARGIEVSGPLLIGPAGPELAAVPFELAVGLGELVRPAAAEPLEAAVGDIDCAWLANALTGGDGSLEISVSGASYSATAAEIAARCEDELGPSVAAAILERLDADLGLRLGGSFAAIDQDADGVAEVIESRAWSVSVEGVPFAASFSGRIR